MYRLDVPCASSISRHLGRPMFVTDRPRPKLDALITLIELDSLTRCLRPYKLNGNLYPALRLGC